jgi:hypothetical protein
MVSRPIPVIQGWRACKNGDASTDHARKHGAEAPHVERVVILAVVDEELRALEVPRGYADVVLGPSAVKLSQAPINQPQLTLRVVDHDIVRFHVAVHHPVGMGKGQCYEKLVLEARGCVSNRVEFMSGVKGK